MIFRRFIFSAVLSAVALPVYAETGASWLRTRVANALNPKISVIGDFVYRTGPRRTQDKFEMREVEIAYQAEVDPNTRADFFFALHDGNFELEEGYFTLLNLPLGLQARGGKFLASFGRLNVVHTHELHQTDRPLALESYLGEEGLNSSGVELSKVFAPLGIFTEVTYAFLNDLGEEHEEEATTTMVTDSNGNTVEVTVNTVEEDTTRGHLRDFANVSRIRFFKDITDATNVELGFSGALHHPRRGEQVKMGDIDLTFRWRPEREGLYRSFIWRTEALYSKRELEQEEDAITSAVTALPATVERWAGYSYVEIQPFRQWRFGVRGDYLEDPEARGNVQVTRAVTPYITFYGNEFNRYRAQYQFKDIPGTQDEHIGWLQWTVTIGPHGAHAY